MHQVTRVINMMVENTELEAASSISMTNSFYCAGCKEEHEASVAGISLYKETGDHSKLCKQQYAIFKALQIACERGRVESINRLKKLKSTIGVSGEKGLKARIEFVKTVFAFRLKDTIIRYELFDEHRISERDFDTCFEMHDGDLVVHGVMAAAERDLWLHIELKSSLGLECIQYWAQTFEKIEEQTQVQPDLFNIAN
jgi:hypothetical protein